MACIFVSMFCWITRFVDSCVHHERPEPGKGMETNDVIERAIHLNVNSKVPHALMGVNFILLVQHFVKTLAHFIPSFQNRKCTDLICCSIYVVFIIIWVAVAIIAVHFGNESALFYGTDHQVSSN